MSLNCCPVCYSVAKEPLVGSGKSEEIAKKLATDERCFHTFENYLQGRADCSKNVNFSLLLPQLSSYGMTCCKNCSKVMKSFSENYDNYRKLKVLLNWKIESVKSLLEGSHESGGLTWIQYVRECIDDTDAGDDCKRSANGVIDLLIQSRESLIFNCSQKLRNSLPRVSLKKLNKNPNRKDATQNRKKLPENSIPKKNFQTIKNREKNPPAGGSATPPSRNIDNDELPVFPNMESVVAGCSRVQNTTDQISRKKRKMSQVTGTKQRKRKRNMAKKSSAGVFDVPVILVEEADEDLNENNEEINPAHQPSYISCRQCKTEFPSLNIFQKHLMEVHTASQDIVEISEPAAPFICVFCSKEYPKESYLHQHVKNVHITVKKKYECPHFYCLTEFPGLNATYIHYRETHLNIKFSCQYCHKSFNDKPSLKLHIRQDCPNFCWSCRFCDLKFKLKKDYRAHLQAVHICEYKCSKCHRTFRDARGLQSHRRDKHAPRVHIR